METGESDRALDRQRLLRSSNTVSFFTPSTPVPAIEVEAGPLNVNTVLFVEGQPKLTNLTPFRKMMNAGDILGSINANPPGNTLGEGWRSMYWRITDQVSSTRRASNAGWNHRAGSARPGWGDNNSPYAGLGGFVSLWTGNPKFVYDGSDILDLERYRLKIEISMIQHSEVINIMLHKYPKPALVAKFIFKLIIIRLYLDKLFFDLLALDRR